MYITIQIDNELAAQIIGAHKDVEAGDNEDEQAAYALMQEYLTDSLEIGHEITDAIIATIPTPATDVLTVDDVCEALKCSKTTLYRYVKAGKLRPAFRVGKGFRFTLEEIGRYQAENQVLLIV